MNPTVCPKCGNGMYANDVTRVAWCAACSWNYEASVKASKEHARNERRSTMPSDLDAEAVELVCRCMAAIARDGYVCVEQMAKANPMNPYGQELVYECDVALKGMIEWLTAGPLPFRIAAIDSCNADLLCMARDRVRELADEANKEN